MKNPFTHNSATIDMFDAVHEARLQELFKAADPASEPIANLAIKLETAARAFQTKQFKARARRAILRRGFALAGVTALAIAMVAAWPKIVLAKMLHDMNNAMSNVKSAHMIGWLITPDGQRVKNSETWYQDGKWRIESADSAIHPGASTQVYADGKLWDYRPEMAKVTLRRQAGPFSNAPSGFTGTALIGEFTRFSWKDSIRVATNDTEFEGRTLRQVDIKTANALETSHVVMLVDPATDLPVQATIDIGSQHGNRSVRLLGQFSFNEPLQAALFEPKFPKSARIFDYDNGKEEWRQRLAKGIARRHVADRTIAIRDLQVNADGHVFLLYTAGRPFLGDKYMDYVNKQLSVGDDWQLEMKDDLGTTYIDTQPYGSFLPTGEHWGHLSSNPGYNPPPNGFLFKGEHLEGHWWVPLQNQRPWHPRTFTLTFHVRPHSTLGLHSWTDDAFSKTISFTLHIARPATALVPDYMPYMNLAPWRAEDIRRVENQARGLLPPGVQESPELRARILEGSEAAVSSLSFSPDNSQLASTAWAGDDSASSQGLKVWESSTGKLFFSPPTQGASAGCTAYSPDSTLIATVLQNKTGRILQLWDVRAKRKVWGTRMPDEGDGLRSLQFTRDSGKLVGVGTQLDPATKSGTEGVKLIVELRWWDARNGALIAQQSLSPGGYVPATVLLPDGRLVTAMQQVHQGHVASRPVQIWRVTEGKAARVENVLVAPGRFEVRTMAASPDGSLIAAVVEAFSEHDTGTTNTVIGQRVQIWDARTGALVQTIKVSGGATSPAALAFSPDGKTLACEGEQNQVLLWDTRTGSQLKTLTAHARPISALAFSPNGRALASGDRDGHINLWTIG
jgi:WD40 repeat protein/outer membrane lipoprotein-sorting protein